MIRLESVDDRLVPEAVAFLAHRPYENVYLTWLLEDEGASQPQMLVARDVARAIVGVCAFGHLIVPAAEHDAVVDAFADRIARRVPPRMIVGPQPNVERLWAIARRWLPAPRAIRRLQPVYMVDRGKLRAQEPFANVRRVSEAEVDEIVPHSATMIAGETEQDVASMDLPSLRRRTAAIVRAGWWWQFRVDDRLAFMCNVGSKSAQTAQLQGVWTPPEFRGLGYATRGLAAICARLLDEFPTLSLYVNDFNAPAIALYERLGFERVSTFTTIIF